MNKLFMVIYVFIVLIFTFMCGITYSYVNYEDTLGNNDSSNNGLHVIYNDTSNLSLVNASIGEKISKTFIISNNSKNDIYYSIMLKNVVNNYENVSDLVYSVSSSNNVYVKDKSFPNKDEVIVKNILIKSNDKHTYYIDVEFKERDYDQSVDLNKTFSSNISVIKSNIVNSYDDNLISMIRKNSISNEKNMLNSKLDGIYYTNSSIDGSTIYFYRGSNNLNNNIVLGNMCFKILRTTIDDGVRIIYSGLYKDGSCSSSFDSSLLYEFNNLHDSNSYVGYMYGNATSDNYINEHSNDNSSDIKIFLDSWYTKNISSYEKYISKDTVYCSDRSVIKYVKDGVSYGKLGYAKNNTGYSFFNSYLNDKDMISFSCINNNDMFSVSDLIGNGKLTNSVSLISASELYYAGYNVSDDNFLNSDYDFWTITPAYFNGNGAYNIIASNGKIEEDLVSNKHYVRPVITLKGDLSIKLGNGGIDSPYILDLEEEK